MAVTITRAHDEYSLLPHTQENGTDVSKDKFEKMHLCLYRQIVVTDGFDRVFVLEGRAVGEQWLLFESARLEHMNLINIWANDELLFTHQLLHFTEPPNVRTMNFFRTMKGLRSPRGGLWSI